MSDQNKGKHTKSVMGNLPSTRPARIGRRRDGEPAAGGTPAAEPKPRPVAKAEPEAPARPKSAAAKPRARATRPKPAATPKPAKPRAVRSGSPSLDAAKKKRSRTPRREPAAAPPKGTELVTTAVQATGELAKIGLTLGGRALKRAVDRLPKP